MKKRGTLSPLRHPHRQNPGGRKRDLLLSSLPTKEGINMKIIGLTGGIATGKSTVAKLFRRVGLHVIDADNVYKELSKPGNILYNKLIAEFSSAIVGKNYEIDWKKLGSMVFSDNQLRERLNSITHPAVREEIDRLVAVGGNPKKILSFWRFPCCLRPDTSRFATRWFW